MNIIVKPKDIRKVMKDEMDMSYRKIIKGSIYANSVENLVLRQQFAMVMISLVRTKMRILNIDETWLGMSDFRRRKW